MSGLAAAFGTDEVARLRRAADRLVAHPFQAWFYGDSIGFEGLLAASELLGEGRYADFVRGFLRGWAARDRPYRPDDNTAPGHVLCAVADRSGDGLLREAAVRLAEHLASRRRIDGVSVTFEDARRSLREPYGPVGAGEEDLALVADPGAGIYVDCLHFDPPFFAHLARLTGNAAWAERSIEEALGYGRLLADPATGLYRHFWLERTGRAYGPGWGRGQGWALLGLLDVVELTSDGLTGRAEVAAAAASLAEAMLRCQRPDGSWPAIVDRDDSGDETSTAAFMVAAFFRGIELGVLHPERFARAAERAWDATWRAVDADGLLTGVSAAVYSSTVAEHYAHVPRGFDVPWGQGPLLVAASAQTNSLTRAISARGGP
jgi:unsaturated rhamnogalacturonyl hydrolase